MLRGCPAPPRALGYLIEAAQKHEGVLALDIRPGSFVARENCVARFWPASRADKDLARRVNESLFVGTYRTPLQDLECSIGEVVELGVRALSPGINDPFTANTCIDRLSAALGRLAKRRWTSPLLKDDEGVVRVIALPFSFPRALDAAFNLFRQYGRTSTSVNVRLPEGLQHISTRVVRQEDRQAIMRQATMIRDGALTALPDEYDREDVEDRFRKIVRTLERPAPVIV